MKATTQSILNLILSDNFKNIDDIVLAVNNNGWGDREVQETTFNESISSLKIILDILDSTINNINSSEKFDNLVGFNDRNTINAHLSNINNHITHLSQGRDIVNQFIQTISALQDIINRIKIDLNIKGLPNYQEKLKEVNYLKSKYNALIVDLDNAKILKEQSQKTLESIEENKEIITDLEEKIVDSQNNIESIEKDITTRHKDIKTLNTNIVEYSSEAKQNKNVIEEFFNEIEANQDTLNDLQQNIKSNTNAFTETIQANIKDNNTKTDEIVKKNQSLNKEILGILGKAIGTNLYSSFETKVKAMKYQSKWWLGGIFSSITLLIIIGFGLVSELSELANNKSTNLPAIFYLRTMLVFPALYAVYFTSHQFNITNKILEEYDFKSSIAVTLHHFKDLVERAEQHDGTHNFMVDSIKSIFNSPTDVVFGNKNNNKHTDEKVKESINNIIDISKSFLKDDDKKIG